MFYTPQAGSPRSAASMIRFSWGCRLLTCHPSSHKGEQEEARFLRTLTGALIPFMRAPPSWPHLILITCFPEAHLLCPHVVGGRILTHGLGTLRGGWRHKHSVHNNLFFLPQANVDTKCRDLYISCIVTNRRKATECFPVISFLHHGQMGMGKGSWCAVSAYCAPGSVPCTLSSLLSWATPTHLKRPCSSITFSRDARCLPHPLASQNWAPSACVSAAFTMALLEPVCMCWCLFLPFLSSGLSRTETTGRKCYGAFQSV